jgi:hypothetical protein
MPSLAVRRGDKNAFSHVIPESSDAAWGHPCDLRRSVEGSGSLGRDRGIVLPETASRMNRTPDQHWWRREEHEGEEISHVKELCNMAPYVRKKGCVHPPSPSSGGGEDDAAVKRGVRLSNNNTSLREVEQTLHVG